MASSAVSRRWPRRPLGVLCRLRTPPPPPPAAQLPENTNDFGTEQPSRRGMACVTPGGGASALTSSRAARQISGALPGPGDPARASAGFAGGFAPFPPSGPSVCDVIHKARRERPEVTGEQTATPLTSAWREMAPTRRPAGRTLSGSFHGVSAQHRPIYQRRSGRSSFPQWRRNPPGLEPATGRLIYS